MEDLVRQLHDVLKDSGYTAQIFGFGTSIKISTLDNYPDGDLIDVYFKKDYDGKVFLSDLGCTFQTIDCWHETIDELFEENLPEIDQLVNSTSNAYFENRQLFCRVDNIETIKSVITEFVKLCQEIAQLFYDE